MNCTTCNFPHPPCELKDGLCHDCTHKELLATRRAKAENDERFMTERDQARIERDERGVEVGFLKHEIETRLLTREQVKPLVDALNAIVGFLKQDTWMPRPIVFGHTKCERALEHAKSLGL